MSVEATGDNLRYQWKRDGNHLSDDRHHGTDTDTLHIVKVKKSDSKAHYRCSVKNEIGEELSEEAVLTVSKLIIGLYVSGERFAFSTPCNPSVPFHKDSS